METNEDSIKMLEMRMRRQMNNSPEKNIKPENIQYYVSSAMLHQENPQDMQQEVPVDAEKMIYQTVYEKLQHGQELTGEEKGILQQTAPESYGKARSIEEENEGYGKLPADAEYEENEEFGKFPADAEYIERVGMISRKMQFPEISETKEVQLARAKNGYARVRRVLEADESFETKRWFPFDVKG